MWVVLVAMGLSSPSAGVQGLHWDAPPSCPSAAEVRARVVAYVGESASDPQLRFAARVSRAGDVYRLELQTSAESAQPETFTLEDVNCSVLADAMAVKVAVAIAPELVGTTPESSAAESSTTESSVVAPFVAESSVAESSVAESIAAESIVPEPPVAEPPGSEPLAPGAGPASRSEGPKRSRPARAQGQDPVGCGAGRSRLRASSRNLRPACGAVSIAGGIQALVLPTVAPAAQLRGALLWPRLRVEGYGGHWFARPVRARGGIGGDVRITAGGAGACYRIGRGPWELPLCVAVEAGVIRGDGVGITHGRRARLPWGAAVPGARFSWEVLRHLAVGVALELPIVMARYRFEIENRGALLTTGQVGLRAAATLEVRWP